MKLTIDPSLKRAAEDFSDAAVRAMYDGDAAPRGWDGQEGLGRGFAVDAQVLDAFTVGAKYLQTADFGKDLLAEWRDERADYKQDDPHFTTRDFVDDLGYLENFTGSNLTQLVRHYLSPKGIDDGDWFHTSTWTSEDGKYIAHGFTPFSFREHDGWLWFQDAVTGAGIAISHDEL